MRYIPRYARAPYGYRNPPETDCPCPICGNDIDFRWEAHEKIDNKVYHKKCLQLQEEMEDYEYGCQKTG